jgi:hypothetical protein
LAGLLLALLLSACGEDGAARDVRTADAAGGVCPQLQRIVAARADKPAFASLADMPPLPRAVRCGVAQRSDWMFAPSRFETFEAYQCVMFESADVARADLGQKAYGDFLEASADCFRDSDGWRGYGGGGVGRTPGGKLYFTDRSNVALAPSLKVADGVEAPPVRTIWTFETAATEGAPAGHQVAFVVYAPRVVEAH